MKRFLFRLFVSLFVNGGMIYAAIVLQSWANQPPIDVAKQVQVAFASAAFAIVWLLLLVGTGTWVFVGFALWGTALSSKVTDKQERGSGTGGDIEVEGGDHNVKL